MSLGTTPGRSTRVELDIDTYGLERAPVWVEMPFQEISGDNRAEFSKVEFIPNIGWRLLDYSTTWSLMHETSAADAAQIRPGSGLLVASGIQTVNIQRWQSELSGVPQGSQRTSGDPMLRKGVAAGASWNNSLSGDQSAFPGPSQTAYVMPLDRVAVTTFNHEPGKSLSVSLVLPNVPSFKTYGELAQIYFTGPAGSTQDDEAASAWGLGQYCLRIDGTGLAVLFERRNTGWVQRRTMRWGKQGEPVSRTQYIRIYPACSVSGADVRGDSIGFVFSGFSDDTTLGGTMSRLVNALADQQAFAGLTVYKVPQYRKRNPVPVPARLDLRRDVRAMFSLYRSLYFTTGTITTKKVDFPLGTVGTDPIRVQVYGEIPSGTSVDVELYGDNALCTATGTPSGSALAFEKTFTPNSGATSYYAKVILSTTNQEVTPTVANVRLLRDPSVRLRSPGALTLALPETISITGPSSDPTHESLGVGCHDLYDEAVRLRTRSLMPIRVTTKYDPSDTTKESILFQGYISDASRDVKGGAARGGFGAAPSIVNWGEYQIRASGEWQRLNEALNPRLMVGVSFDPNAQISAGNAVPYKVTDVVRSLLLAAGYLPKQVDVPDIDIRFYTAEGKDLIIEPFTPIGPVVVQLLRDYLGAYLVWDPNATNGGGASDTDGCWRVLIPPRPPFVPLAEFLYDLPDPGLTVRNKVHPGGYGSYTYSGTSQEVVRTFVRKGTLRSRVVPPEANMVIVTGVAASPGTAVYQKGTGMARVTQYVVNWKSAWFDPSGTRQGEAGGPPAPDPNHPDYLGRVVTLYYADPSLSTEGAVAFVARRLYDMSCHAQKRLTFEAPLVLVSQAGDTKQVRRRPLRYGDPVLVGGSIFFVDSVNVSIVGRKGGDRFQHAVYELFSVPELQNYAAPVPKGSD